MYNPKQSGWRRVINYCYTKHYDKLIAARSVEQPHDTFNDSISLLFYADSQNVWFYNMLWERIWRLQIIKNGIV